MPQQSAGTGVGTDDLNGSFKVVTQEVEGRVEADHVVVEAAGVVRGGVYATTAVVSGTVEGRVEAGNVDVEAGGKVDGEVHADLLRVMGRVSGISRARKVLVRSGAEIEGFLVADRLGVEVAARWDVVVVAREGAFDDREALTRARAAVLGRRAPSAAEPPDGRPDSPEDPPLPWGDADEGPVSRLPLRPRAREGSSSAQVAVTAPSTAGTSAGADVPAVARASRDGASFASGPRASLRVVATARKGEEEPWLRPFLIKEGNKL